MGQPSCEFQVGGRRQPAPNLYGHSMGSTHNRLAGHAVRATLNLVSSVFFHGRAMGAQGAYTRPFRQFLARAVGFLRQAEALVETMRPGSYTSKWFFFWFSLEAEIIQQTCRTLGHAPRPFFLVLPEGPSRHCWNRDEKLDLLVR